MNRRPFGHPRSLCCVYGCNFRRKHGNADLFFKFPKKSAADPGRLFWSWVSAVKIPKRITKDMKVCHRHFTDDDFDSLDGGRVLKQTAVPSTNLPLIWRNKFYSRDYGKLIRQIEVRGIGKLRLCSEAKLCRLLNKYTHSKVISPGPQQNGDIRKKLTNVEPNRNLADEKQNDSQQTAGSTDAATKKPSESSLDPFTSEIDIKDEPMSDQDEAIENLLATLDGGPAPTNQVTSKDGSGVVSCSICGKTSNECSCLSQKTSGNACSICSKQFDSAKQYSDHLVNAHSSREAITGEEMSCQICMIAFQTQDQLAEHNNVLHSKPLPRSHVCILCNQSFRSKVELMDHVVKHAMLHSFPCKVCSSFFNTKDERDAHFRGHGITRKEYECRECGDILKTKAACWEHLNNHIRARLKRGYPCDVCGRVLSTRITLKEHVARHSKEKPYECQLCGRQIRSKMDFLLHVQGHTLGLPHKCTFCGMSFQKKSELNVHVSNEHWQDVQSKALAKGQFECSICGLKFKTENGFIRHAVTHDAYLEEDENEIVAAA